MKEVLFVECGDDDYYYEKFTLYILENRKELHPQFTTPMTFYLLGTQSFYGECLIAINSNQQVVGALGYIYGTPECDFEDQHIVRINMVHIAGHYRGTYLFYNGLKHFINKLNTTKKKITEVQFFIPKENVSLQQLCLKFSNKVRESTSSFGSEILYSASIPELVSMLEKDNGR